MAYYGPSMSSTQIIAKTLGMDAEDVRGSRFNSRKVGRCRMITIDGVTYTVCPVEPVVEGFSGLWELVSDQQWASRNNTTLWRYKGGQDDQEEDTKAGS